MRANPQQGVPMPHMLCTEDHRIIVANGYGMDRNHETLMAALTVIGIVQYILVCSPDYSRFPEKLPGEQVWTINQDLTIPPNVTLFLAPNVFWEGTGNITLWEPIIVFEDLWYRGTGILTLVQA
jgi:hypothetical protein